MIEYVFIGEKRLLVLATPIKQLTEIPMAFFSSTIAKLSKKYDEMVWDDEHPSEGIKKGFTPLELGNRRRKAHNDLMAQLEKEGYAFKDRAQVTEWNNKYQQWVRDEDDNID